MRKGGPEGSLCLIRLHLTKSLDKITLLHESLDYFVDKESSSGAKKWDVEGRLSVVTSIREEIMGNSSLSLLLHILLLNKLAFAIHRELGI